MRESTLSQQISIFYLSQTMISAIFTTSLTISEIRATGLEILNRFDEIVVEKGEQFINCAQQFSHDSRKRPTAMDFIVSSRHSFEASLLLFALYAEIE